MTKLQTIDGSEFCGKYKHFKGEVVEVLGVAHHSETLEELVVYRALYNCRTFGNGSLWIRPMSMFFEEVLHEGKMVPRFAKCEDIAQYVSNPVNL